MDSHTEKVCYTESHCLEGGELGRQKDLFHDSKGKLLLLNLISNETLVSNVLELLHTIL